MDGGAGKHRRQLMLSPMNHVKDTSHSTPLMVRPPYPARELGSLSFNEPFAERSQSELTTEIFRGLLRPSR